MTLQIFNSFLIIISIVGAGMCIKETVESVKNKDFGLDILALIAILATLFQKEYIASVVVVVMTWTGVFLEKYASKKAKSELNKLYDRTPKTIHLLKSADDSNGIDEPIENAKIDDIIKVLPSEVVPADSILLSDGDFDLSSLTGESLPQAFKAGEKIFSGAVVLNTSVIAKILHSPAQSQYQQIIGLVENAQEQKSHTVRLASTISIPFTLISLLIAFSAWFISGESLRFAQVLVLATPCPLLIAAPVAFIGGVSRSARNGIIVKSGGVFEVLNRAKVMAFDKTGTLTKGEPQVVEIKIFKNDFSEKDVLAISAAIESNSKHVFANAIVQAAQGQNVNANLKVTNLQEVVGRGITGEIEGKKIAIGNFEFISNLLITKIDEVAASFPGQTHSYLAVNSELVAIFVLQDEIRENAQSTIDGLKKLSVLHLAMFTGDKRETAKLIGEKLGITDVRSQMLPEQKLEALIGLKHSCDVHKSLHKNSAVAFIGDGVNDAPVLAAADVSIAIASRGESAATQSADVALLKDDISLVLELEKISKQTLTIAKESMVGGITLSIVLMIVAAFGFIPAVAGAGLQELIDILAISNSVRAAFKR